MLYAKKATKGKLTLRRSVTYRLALELGLEPRTL